MNTAAATLGRCDVCRNPLPFTGGGVCAGCTKAINRMTAQGETTMAKKAKAAKTAETSTETAVHEPPPPPITTVSDGKVRRIHRVEPVLPVELPPELEPMLADPGPVEGDELEVELEEPEELPELATGTDAAQPRKYAWLERVNAVRVLNHAIANLSKYDYTKWEIHGVAGAVAVLKNAAVHAAASGPTKAKKVEVGAVVRIREKHAANYDSIIDGDDRSGIKVLAITKVLARLETRSGEKVFLPIAHLEVQS